MNFQNKLKWLYAFIITFGKKNEDLNHEKIISYLAKILQPKIYIELGVYECSLFNKMIPYVKNQLYAIDTNPSAKKFMKKNVKTKFYNMKTDEFVKILKKQNIRIDMLFIDADHNKESVLKDFNNYFPYVKENGIIFLHDGYPKNEFFVQSGYCSNCYEAIFELSQNTKEYEMVTIPLHPGLTICRKRKKQIPWK